MVPEGAHGRSAHGYGRSPINARHVDAGHVHCSAEVLGGSMVSKRTLFHVVSRKQHSAQAKVHKHDGNVEYASTCGHSLSRPLS